MAEIIIGDFILMLDLPDPDWHDDAVVSVGTSWPVELKLALSTES